MMLVQCFMVRGFLTRFSTSLALVRLVGEVWDDCRGYLSTLLGGDRSPRSAAGDQLF